MRLSAGQVQALQRLLKFEFGLEYSSEQAQQAGLAIIRFVIAKQRKQALYERNNDGNDKFGVTEVRQTDASNTNN